MQMTVMAWAGSGSRGHSITYRLGPKRQMFSCRAPGSTGPAPRLRAGLTGTAARGRMLCGISGFLLLAALSSPPKAPGLLRQAHARFPGRRGVTGPCAG